MTVASDRKRVLWLEDMARGHLALLAGPVVRDYDLLLAEDVATACEELAQKEVHVLVVDVRVAAGANGWNYVPSSVRGRRGARLGLEFLDQLLQSRIPTRFPIEAKHCGILTVEPQYEVAQAMANLGITVFARKSPDDRSTLLRVVRAIVKDAWP